MNHGQRTLWKSVAALVTAISLCAPLGGCRLLRSLPLPRATDGSSAADGSLSPATNGTPGAEGGLLGGITFSADDGRSVSGDYPADGSDFTLSVTDAQGITWTLDIPGDALLRAETITMTPIGEIRGTAFPAEFSGGVLLAPDGLQFVQDARITVTKPGGDADGLLTTSNHDGSGLEYMAMYADQGVSASLWHFSAVAWMDPAAQQAGINDMLASDLLVLHESLVKEARELLRQKPDRDIPTPPDISLECLTKRLENGPDGKPSSAMKQIEDYRDKFGGREAELARLLFQTDGAFWKLTEKDLYTGDKKMIQDLLSRIVKKIDKLIAVYSTQPEKHLAVVHTFLTYGRWANFEGLETQPISMLGKSGQFAFEHCMEQIEKNHRFGYLDAIIDTVKVWNFAPDGIAPDALAKRLQKALRFKLHYELLYETSDTVIQIQGDGKMGFVDFLRTYMAEGSGKGSYVSTKVTFSDDPYRIETTFPFRLLMDMDPCGTRKVTLYIDRLAAETETHIVTDNGVDVKSELPGIVSMVVSSIFDTEFVKFGAEEETLAYVFHPELRSGQAEIATQTFEGSYSGAKVTVLLQIQHTPG